EPRRPRRLNRAIPADLETVVLKAMEKNPGDRYATAKELADDLERWLKDEPIRARRPTLVQRARKWSRRHQAIVWSAAACVLIASAILAGSIGWIMGDRSARLEEIARQARGSLNDAGIFIAENNLAAARQKLAEARAQIGKDQAALASLFAEITALETELERFQRFFDLIDRAHEAELAPAADLS